MCVCVCDDGQVIQCLGDLHYTMQYSLTFKSLNLVLPAVYQRKCHSRCKNFYFRVSAHTNHFLFLKQSSRLTTHDCRDQEERNKTICGVSQPVYRSRSYVSHKTSRYHPNRQK